MTTRKTPLKSQWPLYILLLTVLLSIFWGWNHFLDWERTPGKKAGGSLTEIRLGCSTTLLSSPVVIAVEDKLFERHGLQPTLSLYHSGKAALQGLFDGEVDMALAATTPLVFSSFKRNDFRILATVVFSYQNSKLLVLRESGINTINGLRGKAVGVHTGTSGQFFLHSLLAEHGLEKSDIREETILSPQLPEALSAGLVDAIAVWEPHAFRTTQLLGDRVVELSSGESFRTTFNITVKNEYLVAHGDELIAMLQAVNEAETVIREEPARSQRLSGTRMDLQPELVEAIWQDYRFELFLDQALLIDLESQARWLMNQGVVEAKTMPNFLEFIHTKQLKAVLPSAMQIIE